MKATATFYHAGCPVCVAAEQQLAVACREESLAIEPQHLHFCIGLARERPLGAAQLRRQALARKAGGWCHAGEVVDRRREVDRLRQPPDSQSLALRRMHHDER